METDDDDNHICLKCRMTITGLDNYVRHKKAGCKKEKTVSAPSKPEKQETDEDRESDATNSYFPVSSLIDAEEGSFPIGDVIPTSSDANLQADHFFSSLELQSSSKTTVASAKPKMQSHVIMTRRASAALARKSVSESEFHPDQSDLFSKASTGMSFKKELAIDSEFESDDSEADPHKPPGSYTGGKWRPGLRSPPPWRSPVVEDDMGHFPPPSHTSGKWLSERLDCDEDCDAGGSQHPHPGYTGGKWKPSSIANLGLEDLEYISSQHGDSWDEDCGDGAPPPGHTSGKWLPGKDRSFRKLTEESKYFCKPCNRRLTSRSSYEKHNLSEFHFKRTLKQDQCTEVHEEDPVRRGKRIVKRTAAFLESDLWKKKKKQEVSDVFDPSPVKRRRRKMHVRCAVCNAKVHSHLFGKHLVSHYHCRKAKYHPEASRLILSNIHQVVRQSPFQCSICKFYCNTPSTFKRHWISAEHIKNDSLVQGVYWCSLCRFQCDGTRSMERHLSSRAHQEVVSVINRSVPVLIRKRKVIRCDVCSVDFQYNFQLRRHKEKSHGVKSDDPIKFSCSACTFFCFSGRSLQRHVKMAHKGMDVKTMYYCSTCLKRFETGKDAMKHRRTKEHRYAAKMSRGEATQRTCLHCEQKLANALELKQHLQEHHSGFSHKCSRCGMAFSLPQELSRHVRENACIPSVSTGQYCCLQCPYKTDSKVEYLFHEALHRGAVLMSSTRATDPTTDDGVEKVMTLAPRYQCPVCKNYLCKANLKPHLCIHTGERPYVCDICHKSFPKLSSLSTHRKCSHLELWRFRCNECGFATGKKAALQRHKLRHTPREKTFLCATCGKSFYDKYSLSQHMKLHVGKEVKCPFPGCVFSCRSQGELRAHSRVHSDERPYLCDVCAYSGKTKAMLIRHNKIHLGERSHKCPHCSFSARLSSQLRRHLRLHTGAKPYRCPYCPFTCNLLENLRKHVLGSKKHPGKLLYECKFCPDDETRFSSNLAKEFRVHLLTEHAKSFQSASAASTYVAGIYDADNDPRHIDNPIEVPAWRTKLRGRTGAKMEGKSPATPWTPTDAHHAIFFSGSDVTAKAKSPLDPSDRRHQLLSIVALSDRKDDVIYIQLPEGQTDENAMVSLPQSPRTVFLSPTDTMLNSSAATDDFRSTLQASLAEPSAILLPLEESLGLSEDVLPSDHNNEMMVIAVPFSDTNVLLSPPHVSYAPNVEQSVASPAKESPKSNSYQDVLKQCIQLVHEDEDDKEPNPNQQFVVILQ